MLLGFESLRQSCTFYLRGRKPLAVTCAVPRSRETIRKKIMALAVAIGIVALGVIISFTSRKGVTRKPGQTRIPKIYPVSPDKPFRMITKLSWANPVTWAFIAVVVYIIFTVHPK